MDNARALTGARWGGMTTLDHQGGLVDFITSGVTPEERERMLSLTEGPRLFEYFSSTHKPIRLRKAAGHMRSSGFPEDHTPVRSLQLSYHCKMVLSTVQHRFTNFPATN